VKVAVISDVHGNRFALEAVLDDIAAQSVDLTVNLGDILSGPMQPAETCSILMDAGFPTVRGNHDRTVIDRPPEQMDNVDRFAAGELSDAQRAWIGNLPATLAIDDIFLCHGTPTSDVDPWLDDWFEGRNTTLPSESSIEEKAAGFDFPVMLCGHTHIPHVVRLRDGRMIVNPGAVGLQLVRGAPDARYAILERRNGRWQSATRVVPYDWTAAAEAAIANGFPQWKAALTTGWVGPEGLFTRS
jgi:putative phosphoesterase